MNLIKRNLFVVLIGLAVLVLIFPVGAQEDKSSRNSQANSSVKIGATSVDSIEERKTMWGLVHSGGIMMIPLALLALYGFYCGGVQIYVILFSNDGGKDEELLARINPHETLSEVDLQMILEKEIIKRDRAAFPRMVEAAMKRVCEGKAAVQEVLEEEGILQLARLKRGVKTLQGVFMTAPLLGLLGTVYGMIASFQSMGTAGDDKVKFLSEGIYEALVTTAAGLTIAIPFLFLYLWLNKKTEEIGENLNRQARTLLSACYPVDGVISTVELQQESTQKEVGLEESVT